MYNKRNSSNNFYQEEQSPTLLPALPTCSKVHLFFYVLTSESDAAIMLAEANDNRSQKYLAIFLANGEPQLHIKGRNSHQVTRLKLSKTISDNTWHRLDVFWVNEAKFQSNYSLIAVSLH